MRQIEYMGDVPYHYILDENKNPIPATLNEWGNMIRDWNGRNTAQYEFEDKKENIYHISTVFIGMNMNFSNPPTLWETMIFKNGEDIYCDRYTSYNEALMGHEKAVEEAKKIANDF